MRKDPRRFEGAVKNKTACEFNKLKMAAIECIPRIDYPMLILHGALDNVTLPRSSEVLFNTVATIENRKQLILLPGLRHEVTLGAITKYLFFKRYLMFIIVNSCKIFRERPPIGKEVISLAADFITRGSIGNFDKLVYGESSVVIDLQDKSVD